MNMTERSYLLIDTDQHINEPPDLWTSRVSSKYADRAPTISSFPEGDAWVFEGVDAPINFGLNSCAGKPLDQMTAWCRWADVREGGYNPKARIVELDADGIDACLLFPTPRVSQWSFAMKEPQFHLELVRAYNDWLAEYVASNPARLGGLFVVPNRGVGDALAEIERMAGQPGMRGALLGCYPNGSLELTDADDAVWEALASHNLPVHIHVSLWNELPALHVTKVPGDVRFFDAPTRILQFVWAKVFERFPQLKLVFVEVDCGWLPYLKEQADDRFRRQGLGAKLDLPRPPSHYIREHMYFSYITDHYGIRNRHDVGVERMLWSSDYPHVGSNWPNSWKVINAEMSGVEPAERHLMLAGNAQRIYGF